MKTQLIIPDDQIYYTTPCEGYMGSRGFVGSNSNKKQYGADFSKQLREEFKKHNIKNITVKYDHYISYVITIALAEGEYMPKNEYIIKYLDNPIPYDNYINYNDGYSWHYLPYDEYKKMSDDKKLYIKARYRTAEWKRKIEEMHSEVLNDNVELKLNAITRIIDSYNYDKSNGMVDYFDRGFYYKLRSKIKN